MGSNYKGKITAAEIERLMEELDKVVRLGGDTYSSYEVVGLVRQAANEIEHLRAALNRPITMQDIRLYAGEGKLDVHTMLQAANSVLRQRARLANVADEQSAVDRGNALTHAQGTIRETDPRPAEDIIRQQRDEWSR